MNPPHRFSDNGLALLRHLDSTLFDADWPEQPELYWEFRLPKRDVDKEGGWPDLGIIWSDRVLLYELKTEAGSHREGQVDWYFELALHNYPNCDVDLVYLTRDPSPTAPELPSGARYRNLLWSQTADAIEDLWDLDDDEGRNAILLAGYLRDLSKGSLDQEKRPRVKTEAPSVPRTEAPAVPTTKEFEHLREVAEQVRADGKQRAMGIAFDAPEEAKATKRELLGIADAMEEPPQSLAEVVVWVWRVESSGEALSLAGVTNRVELRVSRKKQRP